MFLMKESPESVRIFQSCLTSGILSLKARWNPTVQIRYRVVLNATDSFIYSSCHGNVNRAGHYRAMPVV